MKSKYKNDYYNNDGHNPVMVTMVLWSLREVSLYTTK